jgi:CheY-like chemotaxis protein
MSGETILVVDDHPPNLALMSHLLALHGYRVLTAGDAQETLACLGQHRPDLVLMDLQLPGVDGFELTRLVRERPATAQVPVIAVTSFAMSGDKDRALQAGCDSYVAKPIDTRALPSLVARHLAAARTAG